MARNDSTLLSIASAGPAETYAEVIGRLRAIEAELDPSDGLIWFNRLYTAMTAAVIDAARRHRVDDAVFMERLDCQFANLYFVALGAHLSDPGSGPGCWEPLFRARPRTDILPLQFAVAGVNAHINCDLPVALVNTFLELDRKPLRGDVAHADYQKVNAILEAAMEEAKAWLLTGALALGNAALGQVDDLPEMWSLKRAREAAWVASEVRWALMVSPSTSRHHLEALDRLVGLAGRGLLRPMHHAGVLARPSSSLTGR